MAQTPASSPETPLAVTYIEVSPKSAGAARKLLRLYRDSAARAAGVVQFDAFERIGYKNHFAIVETWGSAKAREANAGSASGKAFRSALDPMLITAYDERPHYVLTAGPAVKAAASAIFAVTHVDIIPPKKDEGVALTKKLGEDSRGTPGNLRFDVLTQGNRPNHMTVVESWKDRAAQSAHTASVRTTTYRKALTPMTGSLYDERLYTLVK